ERIAETGLGNLALDQLELTAGLAHLHCSHSRQRCSLSRLRSRGLLPVPEEFSRRGSSRSTTACRSSLAHRPPERLEVRLVHMRGRKSRSTPCPVRTTSGSTEPVPAAYRFVCNCEGVMVAEAKRLDCLAAGEAIVGQMR